METPQQAPQRQNGISRVSSVLNSSPSTRWVTMLLSIVALFVGGTWAIATRLNEIETSIEIMAVKQQQIILQLEIMQQAQAINTEYRLRQQGPE